MGLARPVGDIELPRSVQGLIATRLDGLPDQEKAVLQDAAVIGRVFWLGSVAELAGRGRAPRCGRRSAGSASRNSSCPTTPRFSDELEFSFRHNLIRDGAYESLPKALRADKHARGWPDGPSSEQATARTRSPS